MKQKEPIWIMILRVALAAVFLYSGFIKGIDPIGFGIKIDEYFISFGLGILHPIALFCAVIAITMEFVLGFMLLFRIKVKLTSLGYLLFMSFFFLLTLWLAVAEHLEVNYGYNFGVVKDCGCFGAAIELSNLETFLKNVVIMIPTIIIFVKRKQIPDIRLTELGQWCFACVGGMAIIILQLYCYLHLPIIDYSDWKKGADLVELYIEQPEKKEMVFVYRNNKDSSMLSLTADEMGAITDTKPKFYDEYEYVDRIDKVVAPADTAEIDGFNMLDANGKDHAPGLIDRNSLTPLYLLVMHNLDEVNGKAFDNENLQNLIKKSTENDMNFVGITNSSQEKIDQFIARYNITYPIYTNPIDPIKGPFMVRDAIRSNPGLLLIERGFVKEKWNWRDVPMVQ
ncbi:MAG: DoxX family protein [Bacteroidales bacterium]|jgi:uncharacterized membrane protein YphA (DoxX/SURF4 family)|nr:DoxX family protein [Bacteroidales bacterium]